MRSLRLSGLLCLAVAASLSACGPSGGVASPGSTPGGGGGDREYPVEMQPSLPQGVAVAAAVADATLPPPASVSPTAKTTIDDAAVSVAWNALDTAAYAADTLLAAKPSIAGSVAARRLAQALEGASTWLTIASRAQRASQAENYRVALAQAGLAMTNARTALTELKGK